MPTSSNPDQLLLRTPRAIAADDLAPLTPRRILVLGATSGIAQATCRLWAERGDHLFLIARNADKLAAIAADLQTRGAGCVGSATADLDRTASHAELLTAAIDALGGLDIAFLALGVLGDQALAEQDFVAAESILRTNLISALSLLTWLGNHCEQRGHGTLTVLSSVAGDRGRKSNYVYGASKAGLSAFTDGLRHRLDRHGVHVMTIKPGPVKTAMTESMKGSARFADVDAVAATLVAAIDKGTDVVYVPAIWRILMAVIRHIPERLFKTLDL